MNIKYNLKADALYIVFSDKKPSTTKEIGDDIIVDLNGNNLIGIELLNVSSKVPNKSLKSVSVSI